MADQKRWIARLTPAGDIMVERLIGLGYSLHAWEVEASATGVVIIVAAEVE
jgi:hypothetical protein